jgi:putative inorganic carbon (HCO3(-)) transporter
MDLVNRAYLIESFEKRVELWSRAVLIIQDFPITGIGMGSFGAAGDLLYPFIHSLPEAATHAHNLFLQIAVDLGLPGLLAWIVLFLWVVVCSWRIFTAGRATGNTWQAGLGAGLLCSQAALALYGLVDAVTWGMTRTPPFVWLLWGVAVAGASLLVKPPSDH